MVKRSGAIKKMLSNETIDFGLAILARAIALRYIKDLTGTSTPIQSLPVNRKEDKS
jgi:hypothetical protein